MGGAGDVECMSIPVYTCTYIYKSYMHDSIYCPFSPLSRQWTILICIMVALNWWMKPITRVTPTSIDHTPLHDRRKIKDIIMKIFIREEPAVLLSHDQGSHDTQSATDGHSANDSKPSDKENSSKL